MGNKGMGWVTGGAAFAAALSLVACGGSDTAGTGGGGVGGVGGIGGSAGIGGTGGTAGIGGTGGTAGIGGTGGTAGIGGTGGTGGTGGVSGTGGTGGAPMCGSGADIRTGAQCESAAEGYFAIKTKVDVWWQGVPTRDPGRGNIEIYLLARLDNVCADGSGGVGTIKSCGTRLPPFTSDVACDAFQIEFPDQMWESPTMPRFTTTGNTTGFNPGDTLTLDPAVGLVGLDLMNGQERGTFPTAAMTGSFPCEAGTGPDCFPDHDNDQFPGVTISLRHDAATYVGPYGNGKCTNGTDYKYRGAPTLADIGAGGGAGGGVRAINVRIGLRTALGGGGVINSDCASGSGPSMVEFIDSRALDCIVDPTTLPAADARKTSMDYACTSAEAQFVDDNVPIYRVLGNGEMPGDSMKPLGWVLNNREIDKTASQGSKAAVVRLGSLTGGEPACSAVRGAAYPAI